MKKLKTAKAKPLLTKTEKAAIKAAKRILKKLTARYRDLEESEWAGGVDESKAMDDYVDALAKEHIDVDSVGCFIVLEDD
jgi:uncharacterized lipoprotein YehR (DUF1307 family)